MGCLESVIWNQAAMVVVVWLFSNSVGVSMSKALWRLRVLIPPCCGERLRSAIPSALVTSNPVWRLSIDQPTTMRENASMIAQQ